MDDNARPHQTPLAVEELLESEDITRMDWPAYSADLNPIEHVWDALGRRIAARLHHPEITQQLKQMLIEEWALLRQEMLHQLVLSMRRRCEVTIAAEESDTDSNSQTSEEAKIQLKTALVYCEQLLLENNKIATEPSAVIKEEHMKIGEKLYSTIMETLAENIIVIEDDLILFEEANEEGLFEEVEDSGLQSDDEYHPDKKGRKLIRMTFRLIIK
ncbi:transposable element Tcb2 transposase [Trichonephila clavipes]|nr:transposable element Tcb2 transposase [Trichonephila clavipes]